MKKVVAKKLGEVCAFAAVSQDTYLQGKKALTKVFDEDFIHEITTINSDTVDSLNKLMKDDTKVDVFSESVNETTKKIEAMRKIYLEDKWNETDEVLEWLGFIEGSATVHWNLVEELVFEENLPGFKEIAGKIKPFHTKLFKNIAHAIKKSE